MCMKSRPRTWIDKLRDWCEDNPKMAKVLDVIIDDWLEPFKYTFVSLTIQLVTINMFSNVSNMKSGIYLILTLLVVIQFMTIRYVIKKFRDY